MNTIQTLLLATAINVLAASPAALAYTGACNKAFHAKFDSVPLRAGKIAAMCPGGLDTVVASDPRADKRGCWISPIGAESYAGNINQCTVTLEVQYDKAFSASDQGCTVKTYRILDTGTQACLELFQQFEIQQGFRK